MEYSFKLLLPRYAQYSSFSVTLFVFVDLYCDHFEALIVQVLFGHGERLKKDTSACVCTQ